MDIRNTARHFDRDPISDGYTGAFLFKGQTASFNDASSDGATNRRRILSIAPNLVMPTRRVLSIYGDRWVVGTGTPDGFMGFPMRVQFTMKRVTDLMTLLTPQEALTGALGTAAYIQKQYYKDTVNPITDSEYDTHWHVFVAPGEPVGKGSFLKDAAGTCYRVRNAYLPLEGLRLCQTDQLEANASALVTLGAQTYDPVSDSFSGGTSLVNGIMVEPSKFYRLAHMSEATFQAGDLALFLPAAAAVKANTTLTMNGKSWRVLDVQPELDAQVAHVRLA